MKLKNLNPKHGEALMGCNDTEYVGVENEIKFSRIYDLFISCIKLGIDPESIWNGLDYGIKIGMNYGNWKYVK
jgi:hypothetical protein